jgi:hypothetical protein
MTKTTPGSSNNFSVSRAVEEPLEATFELGDELENQASKLTQTVIICVLGCIFGLLLFLYNSYEILRIVIDNSLGRASIGYSEFFKLLIAGLIIIFLLAMIVTILVYIFQIYKFNSHLLQRYELVSELKTAEPDRKKGMSKKNQGNKAKSGSRSDTDVDLELAVKPDNPIHATLDLVEEAMHEIPQLIRLFKICKYFMMILLVFIELNIVAELLVGYSLFYVINQWELIINFGFIFFILYSIYLLNTSEKLFLFLNTRHEIIDSIRFGEPMKVPQGKNKLVRMINHLIRNDPFIKNSGVSTKGWTSGKVNRAGQSGQEHTFNAYFSAENNLKNLSSRICVPPGRFVVFIREFKTAITFRSIKKYHQAVQDVCRRDDTFPLRIIAIQRDIDDLDDDVYDYVLDNPIEFSGCMSNIQIAAEDGEYYSFIPQISYGGGLD